MSSVIIMWASISGFLRHKSFLLISHTNPSFKATGSLCKDLRVIWSLNFRSLASQTYLPCSFGLFWLISHGWKYYWLIWCERKLLFIDWKSTAYKSNKPKRTGRINYLQSSRLKIVYPSSQILDGIANGRFQASNNVAPLLLLVYLVFVFSCHSRPLPPVFR